jgi:hypothetical protein
MQVSTFCGRQYSSHRRSRCGTTDAVLFGTVFPDARDHGGQNPLEVIQGSAGVHAPGEVASHAAAAARAAGYIGHVEIKGDTDVFVVHGGLLG